MKFEELKESTMDSGESDVKNKYLSKKVRAEFDLFRMDPHWSVQEVYNAIFSYGTDKEWVEERMRDLVNHRKEDSFDPNDEPFRSEFIDAVTLQYWKGLKGKDILTQLGSMSPYNQAVVSALSYKELSQYFFLKTLYPFGYGTITGIPGSGKTHQGVNFIDMSLQGAQPYIPKPFRVATNITILDTPEVPKPEGITQVATLREVILACIENMQKHGALTNIVLDELPQSFNKKRAMSGSYVNMEKMLLLFRKVGGNFIAIVQRPEDVPSVVQSFSHMSMHKLSKNTMQFKRDEESYVIKDVPQTRLKFDTRDIASFIIDVNMDEIHAHLTNLPKGTDQIQAIKELLGSRGNTSITDRMVDSTVVVLHDLRELPFDEIGLILGFSASTVWSRYKKFKGIA